MNRDDFVEEDSKDATGYADNGMEDWDRDSSDSEDRKLSLFLNYGSQKTRSSGY